MADIVVRIWSKSGRSRITLPGTSTLSTLKEQVISNIDLHSSPSVS